MKNTNVLIGLIMIAVSIGSANAITPISLDVNLLEDGANIDTSKLVTICYNTDDASTPPNPLPVSINTVDDLDPVEGPIYLWGLYDSSYDPCTSGSDCKSKLCASFVIFSAGTDIVIQVEGYEDHTFSSVTSSVGPVDVDLTPTGTASPSATVLHPNGGESIPIGTQVQVSAHATDDTAVTSVTFSYSSNGGSDWNSIGAGTRVSGTDKDGTWNRTWNTNGLDAGSNYLIKAAASDGTSTREDQSDSTFSLTCTPPSAPALNDPGTTDTDGSYTVSWSSVSGATSYTLEEDTSGSFGSPTVVYSGSGTSTQITGRSDGTYYYRVKACNACGCSGWSNVEDIEVIPSGNIITVDDSGEADYTTIQEATNNAGDGYTIKVFPGTYAEHVATNKSLKLIGEDKETTIIDGGGSGQCIYMVADNVEISGFTIQNGIYGVWLESSDTCIINNNIISDNYDGIYLSNSNNNTITHNSLSNNIVYFSGIHLSSSNNNAIIDNDLSENRGGISLFTSHNNLICRNNLNNNGNKGIYLSSSSSNTICDNSLSENDDGVYLYNSNSNLIYHNNLIDNINQAYDDTDTNQWDNDYPSGGNYWSNYMGEDHYSGPDQDIPGSDGMGDTPYCLSGGSLLLGYYHVMDYDDDLFHTSNEEVVDRYPLMQPRGGTPSKGDLNSDGTLTPADATIVLQIAACGGWDPAADMNSDDCITSLDALMILSMTPTTQPSREPPCDSYGDVDDDSYVTVDDYDLVHSYVEGGWDAVKGKTSLTSEEEFKRRADIDGDDEVSFFDSVFIDHYINGTYDTFPLCP